MDAIVLPVIFRTLGLLGDNLQYDLSKLKALIDIGLCINTQIDRNIKYSCVYPNSDCKDTFVPKNATLMWVAAEKICDLNLVAFLMLNDAVAEPVLSEDGQLFLANVKQHYDRWKTIRLANNRREGKFAELPYELFRDILEKLTIYVFKSN